MRARFILSALLFPICAVALSGCARLSSAGFLRSAVDPEKADATLSGIQLVDVTDAVARQILARRSTQTFSDAFGTTPIDAQRIGPGDVVAVTIWEAPPAALFTGVADPRLGLSTAPMSQLPEQTVNDAGVINIPFVGPIKAAGRSPVEIEADIARELTGKANQPQVLVRIVRNVSSTVTVVGEVGNSALVPLTPHGERLLDALAAAGGVRQPVNKMTIQVTRGTEVRALPLEAIIKDPKQNVPLHPGDVVTALFQPLSFTALGATGKNEEITFEAQGITLAQALARSGGVNDARADAEGVFIFRLEPPDALAWPRQPVMVTPENKVPVIYRVDLKDPRSFFVAQAFPVDNKDLLYISNAPAAELQKFLNLVFSVVYPLSSASAAFR